MSINFPKNEIPWTFKSWIANFKNVDLPIGDLAKDVSRDKYFPDTEDYKVIYDYLNSKQVHQSVLCTFDATWKFYQKTR